MKAKGNFSRAVMDGLDLLANTVCSVVEEDKQPAAASETQPPRQELNHPSSDNDNDDDNLISNLLDPEWLSRAHNDPRWKDMNVVQMVIALERYDTELPCSSWDPKIKGFKNRREMPAYSIRRMFKRSNPTFFDHFILDEENWQWIPRKGKDHEMARRDQIRQKYIAMKMKQNKKRKKKVAAAVTTKKKKKTTTTAKKVAV
eukprot:scaffold667_cov117-Cylindrotheca_fusiformis.AAC.1